MYSWYQNASICYVYLSDVSFDPIGLNKATGNHATERPWESSFRKSRWFTRGWTLQELLAPREVVFFSREWYRLGTKNQLKGLLHEITGILTAALEGLSLSQFSVAERLRWSRDRKTKLVEDQAYCLLGICDVYMRLMYGEGEDALHRLDRKIKSGSSEYVTLDHRKRKHFSLGLCLTLAPLLEPDNFVGRTVELDVIHSILNPHRTAGEQQWVVLEGMGGVGKTQLAIAYARRFNRSYDSVLWFDAATESTLFVGLRSIARLLIDAGKVNEFSDKQIVASLQEWLSNPENTRWLLIFDNYDGSDQYSLDNFCPNIGHGSVIVTTRLADSVTGSVVRIQPLTNVDEILGILQKTSKRDNVTTDGGAYQLVKRLGGLPLALATAGGYLHRTSFSFQQYLDVLLESRDYDAAQLLRLFAYFDHQHLQYDVLAAGLSVESMDWLQECLANRIVFESLIQVLVECSFAEPQADTGSYSIHSCVHDQNRLEEAENMYLRALIQQRTAMSMWHTTALTMVNNLGIFYQRQGKLEQAERMFRQALSGRLRTLGTKQVSTLDTIKDLSSLYADQGRLVEADQLLRNVITGREAALGLGHPSTILMAHRLSLIRHAQKTLELADKHNQQPRNQNSNLNGPFYTSIVKSISSFGQFNHLDGNRTRGSAEISFTS